MNIKNLESYEQIQIEALIRGLSILDFIKNYNDYKVDNKYFIFGKRIFAFDKNGNFLDSDYEVNGNFVCFGYSNLTSLKGGPRKVSKNFSCSFCHDLISLEYSPEVVNNNFSCSGCVNLTSLKGGPKEVGGDFNCSYCKNLTSLKDIPKEIGKNLICLKCYNLPTSNIKCPNIKGKIYK